jgi:hypothetical protein
MDTRRWPYLASRQDDFAELAAEARLDASDIPCAVPANDNPWPTDGLSARCGNLLRRLIALHGLRWSD